MQREETLNVTRETKGKLPRLPFLDIKNKILGTKYDLSIAFVGREKSRELNKRFRDKDYATNILSFNLSKSSGELVINLEKVRRDAPNFEKSYHNFLGFLVIHGMLHLKGMEHSSRIGREEMEREEEKYDQKYFYRNRRRLHYDAGRSGRILKRRKKS